MKPSKPQEQSKPQQTQAQPKQQGQNSQSKQQKQASIQSSMNEYGTMTAKQDANADYSYTSSSASSLDQKAQKYSDKAGQGNLS